MSRIIFNGALWRDALSSVAVLAGLWLIFALGAAA